MSGHNSSVGRRRRRAALGAAVCLVILVAEFVVLQGWGAAGDDALEASPPWTPWVSVVALLFGVAMFVGLAFFTWRAITAGRDLRVPPPEQR